MYHSIPVISGSRYEVSKSCFEEHLKCLKANVTILSVPAIVSLLAKKQSRDSLVCGITFDDGYKDNYENAYPLLKKHEVSATIFLCTSWLGAARMLDWSEIREMEESGLVTFGAHTQSHRNLTSLSEREIISEVECSRKIISDKLGNHTRFLSVPGGRIDDRVQKTIARACNVEAVFTSEGVINTKSQNTNRIGRVCVYRKNERVAPFLFKIYGLADLISRFKHRTLRM